MSWLRSLLAANDRDIDTVGLAGTAAILSLCAGALVPVVRDHKPLDPQAFGLGAAAIVAGIGAGKGARDKLTPQPPE